MSNEQRQKIEVIAMDMWDQHIHIIRSHVPHVKIAFDLFIVVSSFDKVIDKVRNAEYRKA